VGLALVSESDYFNRKYKGRAQLGPTSNDAAITQYRLLPIVVFVAAKYITKSALSITSAAKKAAPGVPTTCVSNKGKLNPWRVKNNTSSR
jgi:hypothetical protein